MKSVVSGMLCLAIGLGVGATYAGLSGAGQSTTVERVNVIREGEVGGGLTRNDIRFVVRSEQRHAQEEARVAAAAAGEAKVDPEIEDRAARADDVIDAAIARGVWNDADRDALHEGFDGLPGERKAEIFAKLADAVNRGQVTLATEGLPL